MTSEFRQGSLDDLGAPLVDTTFVVVDLETTGGSPGTDTITEVGAVKVRGGNCLGTFQTLVNPGRAIPPTITVLTGITESMVTRAPRIESVLPSLLEFMGDAVIVGHNVRFDVGFLQAALERDGRPPLTAPTVDTVALARRLLRDEVPNCKLGTLADRLRLSHRPSHRALDDALATADLLHVLLERAGSLGVTGFDDLSSLPGGYDLIICAEVLEHLERPEDALDQIVRLRPARVLLTVPHEPWFMLSNLAMGKNITRFGNDLEHCNHFTVPSFKKLLSTRFNLTTVTTSYPWILATGKPL